MNKCYEKNEKPEINRKRSPRTRLTMDIPDVNRQRIKLGAKGYLTIIDLRTYLGGVSYGKARKIYNQIKYEVESDGKTACNLGVPTANVNNYLNLTEAQIEKYAAMGL